MILTPYAVAAARTAIWNYGTWKMQFFARNSMETCSLEIRSFFNCNSFFHGRYSSLCTLLWFKIITFSFSKLFKSSYLAVVIKIIFQYFSIENRTFSKNKDPLKVIHFHSFHPIWINFTLNYHQNRKIFSYLADDLAHK